MKAIALNESAAPFDLRLASDEALVSLPVPQRAAAWRQAQGGTVLVWGAAQPDGPALHWLESAHARGWVEPAAGSEALTPGMVRDRFTRAQAAGFVGADAVLLALMGAPMAACSAGMLPRLSWGEAPRFVPWPTTPRLALPMGIYALVESAARLQAVLDAGVRTVQMRIKTPAGADAPWRADLQDELARAVEIAGSAGAELFVNDHWALAGELAAPGVHLGQEDLLALGEEGRTALLASGVGLGISSHSVWELCRARALAPRYIACGPVWPTTTKDMPWLPQGLDNLRWWCRHAGTPVVAIGGILQPAQVQATAACGADGVCIVRGLGESPGQVLPDLRQAFDDGHAAFCAQPARTGTPSTADWPHPSLPPAQADSP